MSRRTLIVHHEPVGQPRHRVSTRGGHARMYLPGRHPVHAFKKAIQLEFGKRLPSSRGIKLSVKAWFARPKSKIWKRRPMPEYRHTSKPDFDNILKAVADALNGLAWHDDAQICVGTVEKWVCDGESLPQVIIEIEEID